MDIYEIDVNYLLQGIDRIQTNTPKQLPTQSSGYSINVSCELSYSALHGNHAQTLRELLENHMTVTFFLLIHTPSTFLWILF